ncbi:MAG: DNA-3-methyladenine glycosylase 2 family protein [Verrucomicrobiota bacterium]
MGPCQIRREPNRFQALVRSILSQQISGAAAASIYRRLRATLGANGSIDPQRLAGMSIEQLRTAGVSASKAAYLLDLARKVTAKEVRLDRIGRFTDAEVIAELIQIKGIGVWTAQMFLIFSLRRIDVFPADDLGVRVALKNLYGLKELPDRKTSERIAAPWRPYATVGSWYCWRSLELPKL